MTAVGPRPPHLEEILALADEFGLEMDVDEAAEYEAVMGGAFRTYQALDHTTFAQEVSKQKHANQRRGIRYQKYTYNSHEHRKY